MALSSSSSGPRTLIQCCLEGGETSDDHFLQLSAARSATNSRRRLRRAILRRHLPRSVNAESDDYSETTKVRKNWREPRCVWARKDEDGNKVPIAPEESCWYIMYVNNELMLEDKKMQSKFRRRFRLPYASYLDLVDLVTSHELFDRWCGEKINNKKASPIELLVLGVLRYLGRGWTFDDIEECTAVSSYVHRAFLRVFIRFGATVLYDKYVTFPQTVVDASSHIHEFEQAGFPGCIGSSDCTHITVKRCYYGLRNQHLGAKSNCTTRTFNLTVNHRRQILHSSRGGPGSWNDQTMVRRDNFIQGIYNGDYLNDVPFVLKEIDSKTGEVRLVQYQGAYVIVDNGYLRWSVTVPPFKVTNITASIRWSKWVESMRKDVRRGDDTGSNL